MRGRGQRHAVFAQRLFRVRERRDDPRGRRIFGRLTIVVVAAPAGAHTPSSRAVNGPGGTSHQKRVVRFE